MELPIPSEITERLGSLGASLVVIFGFSLWLADRVLKLRGSLLTNRKTDLEVERLRKDLEGEPSESRPADEEQEEVSWRGRDTAAILTPALVPLAYLILVSLADPPVTGGLVVNIVLAAVCIPVAFTFYVGLRVSTVVFRTSTEMVPEIRTSC